MIRGTASFLVALAAHVILLSLLAPRPVTALIAGTGFEVQFGLGTNASDSAPSTGDAAEDLSQGEAEDDAEGTVAAPTETEAPPEPASEPEAPVSDTPSAPSDPAAQEPDTALPPQTESEAPAQPEPEPQPEPVPEPEDIAPEEDPVTPKPEPDPQPEPEPEPKPEPQSQTEPQPEPQPAPETAPAETLPNAQTSDSAGPSLGTAPPSDLTGTGPDKPSTLTGATGSSGAQSGDDVANASAAASPSQAGNAESSNYAGLVMQHISRIRRPRAETPGSAFIRFAVGSDGSLDLAEVSQSSGSSRFDRQALRLVERAAPFPVPPSGVNREFTIEIEGR
ncbi:MAG: TonB family protein [Pseudomonadota bacterium]